MLWLYAGIHLRDSFVFMVIAALTWLWVLLLVKPTMGFRFVATVIGNVSMILVFYYLRAEYVFVPLAMLLASVAALFVSEKKSKNIRVQTYLLLIVTLVITSIFISFYGETVLRLINHSQGTYSNATAELSSQDSLGAAIIVNQPMPIRIVLGAIYMFVYPIPFWSGFNFATAYHLFKSLNVLFFYCLTPLMFLAIKIIYSKKIVRETSVMFVLFLSIGFPMAVAITSLETRHFGAFLSPIFLLCLLPDLRIKSVKNNYFRLLISVVVCMLLGHFIWAIMKYIL
jgi:hypothetical protein